MIPKAGRRNWRAALVWVTMGSVGLLSAAYVFLTGPHDLSQYPQAISSPYKLPWPAGVSWPCIQSNRGIVSHRGWEEFAYDFKMPEGSDVCAARGGRVIMINVNHHGSGLNAPNNRLVIEHPDGSRGVYLHLLQNGALVKIGERVQQGQKIARSGHVGRSMTPHLHFHVAAADGSSTVPISFADITSDLGVPRMFYRYTSANQVP